MLIANPIYDVVFKRLMENEQVAKFFISTMLNEEVLSVNVQPQEFTYDKDKIPIAIFRLDFIAIIKDKNGDNKKILIEIQKSRSEPDLMRFRNYVAEQYKKQDVVNNIKTTLPITTIYILGFNLPNIETACVKVERSYIDLINNAIIKERNEFIENLTHDSFIVQVERITNRYKSKLDKLLSVFEQNHFMDDRSITKEYKYETDIEEVDIMTNILHKVGVSPEERREIETEQEAFRTYMGMFENQREGHKAEIEEKNKIIDEKDKALDEKDKALDEKDKIIEELKKRLGE